MAYALRSFSLFLCIAQRERERERDRFRLYHMYAFDDISIANSNGKEHNKEDKTKHIIKQYLTSCASSRVVHRVVTT